MCGRYARERTLTWREIHAFSQPLTLRPAEDPPEAYNIAPTQPGYVIRPAQDSDECELVEMRWGLLPVWAKDAKLAYSTFNARVETAATKPLFRSAWKSRRCIIPASGYYEWPVIAGEKRPQYIHPTTDPMLMFAGLWEPGHGDRPDTYTIVTTEADDSIVSLHDRMPIMLSPDVLEDWVRGTPDQAMEIAAAAGTPALAFHEVGKAVGNVRNQGEELIKRIS